MLPVMRRTNGVLLPILFNELYPLSLDDLD